jgi:hypothetical protein
VSPAARGDDGRIRGSGPEGRIELTDIKDKLDEITGEVDDAATKARPMLTYVAVGAAVVVVGLAFVLGRRAGRRKSTWVEIRRK